MNKSLVFTLILGALCSCKAPVQSFTPAAFISGVDLSYVNQVEDFGGTYSDSSGNTDPFRIFQQYGANTVRVRLWHDPSWTSELNNGTVYGGMEDVTKTVRRAKASGMMVNLDLHYSDDWADPAKQHTPKAWAGLSVELLKDSVYRYTMRVLRHFESVGLVPEMIQIGNETNNGMLFPAGRVENGDFQAFAGLLNSGIKAVRDFSAGSLIKPRVIIHVAQLQNAGYWVSRLLKAGVEDFDILGLSHYYKWSEVNSMQAITDTIAMLCRTTRKKVMMVETAYPWTTENADRYANVIAATDALPGYPASREGQAAYIRDLYRAVYKGGGSGVMYWEPAWITSALRDQWGQGSSWDNCTLFDFRGRVLPGIRSLQFLTFAPR